MSDAAKKEKKFPSERTELYFALHEQFSAVDVQTVLCDAGEIAAKMQDRRMKAPEMDILVETRKPPTEERTLPSLTNVEIRASAPKSVQISHTAPVGGFVFERPEQKEKEEPVHIPKCSFSKIQPIGQNAVKVEKATPELAKCTVKIVSHDAFTYTPAEVTVKKARIVSMPNLGIPAQETDAEFPEIPKAKKPRLGDLSFSGYQSRPVRIRHRAVPSPQVSISKPEAASVPVIAKPADVGKVMLSGKVSVRGAVTVKHPVPVRVKPLVCKTPSMKECRVNGVRSIDIPSALAPCKQPEGISCPKPASFRPVYDIACIAPKNPELSYPKTVESPEVTIRNAKVKAVRLPMMHGSGLHEQLGSMQMLIKEILEAAETEPFYTEEKQ